MRYEWGLAVGHTYAHGDAVRVNQAIVERHAKQTPTSDSLPATNTVARAPEPYKPNADRRVQESLAPELLVGPEGAEEDGAAPDDDDDDVDGDEDDMLTDDEDEEDYRDDPERDEEDEREYELFGAGS